MSFPRHTINAEQRAFIESTLQRVLNEEPEYDLPPTEEEEIETSQAENMRFAWFFIGRLVFSGIIELPQLNDPQSLEKLRYALSEITFCIENDD